MKEHLHKSLRALFLFLAVLLSLPMLAQKLNLKEARLIDNVRELSLKEGQGNITVPAPARHVVNNLAMKTPSRTENINPYEAMAGEWTMTTASGKEWDVRVYAASEDDPDYNKILYVTGMMGYDWTMLTMRYSYNNEEGKPEVYIKAGELFAENVNFSGLGVCNIYLYNIEGNYLTLKDMVADVSADGRTLDFGENIFTAALFMDAQFTGLTWFIETGVKMTQKSGIKLNGIYYSLNAETMQATVIESYDGGYSGDIVIPESVNYNGTAYSVTSIGYAAFLDCTGLTSVTIPNSVTSIGAFAFKNCDALTSVHISDIAAWCNIDFPSAYSNPLFYAHHLYLNGEEVKDLVIPNSVDSIGVWAFYACDGLTSVTIPNSVESIEYGAFQNCTGLTSVTIGNSVTSIGAWAFGGCSALASITIGNNVEIIGYAAFDVCSALVSVTIPNSVKTIGESAFYGCSGLTSVTIGNSVEIIGYAAFLDCSALISVTIPNSVTNIGDYAFNGCSGLPSVTIPNSVTSIGTWAFYKCYELLDVYCYAENVPSTDSNTFRYSPIADATLHVPVTSMDSYKATAPWSGFGKIVALTPEETGIDELKGENGKVKTDVYDLSGRRVQGAQKGIFIQNGKVMVR